MHITPYKTDIFQQGQDLLRFLDGYLTTLHERDVVVVTSKVVALSEDRVVIITDEHTKEKTVKQESDFAIRTEHTWLTIKDGIVMAAAGVDESNANGSIILLPKDSYRSADMVRNYLRKKHHLTHLGVIISDSRTLPLHAGITGIALGYAGFSGLKDYRGTPDIFGRKLKMSRVDVADSLAGAAVFMMGEGDERQPIAVIDGVDVVWIEKVDPRELSIDPRKDLYYPLFEYLSNNPNYS